MTAWFRIALAVLEIAVWLIRRSERQAWINEGERRLAAKQLKAATERLATAARIEDEYRNLTDDELYKRVEEKGWYRD